MNVNELYRFVTYARIFYMQVGGDSALIAWAAGRYGDVEGHRDAARRDHLPASLNGPFHFVVSRPPAETSPRNNQNGPFASAAAAGCNAPCFLFIYL
jgi:hypothetical protein